MSSMEQKNLVSVILNEMEAIKEDIPEVIANFSNLSNAALKPGKLDAKCKALIALGMALAIQSPACVKFHLETLIKIGLSYEELLEVVAIAVYMGGGPLLTIALDMINIFRQKKNQEKNSEQVADDFTTPEIKEEIAGNVSASEGHVSDKSSAKGYG